MAELIIIGDRVLIEPDEGEQTTASGLVLPASVKEADKVGSGKVVRVGPGYVMPNPEFTEGESWAQPRQVVRYLPLQAQPGDYAFYLRKEAVEISYEGHKYFIVQHGAILALVRTEPEDILDNLQGLVGE